MENISDALTKAAGALVAASKNNQYHLHDAADNALRATFGDVVRSGVPDYQRVVLHLIWEQAKIAPARAIANLMNFSNRVPAKDQASLEAALTAMTDQPHMDQYLQADGREIDPHDQKSHIGQKFLNESLGMGAPVTSASASRYTRGIAVTLGKIAAADPKLDSYAGALMEIVRNDAYSPAQKRDALILMNDKKIQPRLDTIEPGFIGNHVTPTAVTVFSDPALSLEDLQKNYKKFLAFLTPESPLAPSAMAVYPAVRDAGFKLLEPEQDSHSRLNFLEHLMTDPHHYIADLYRKTFKDYEDIAVPLIQQSGHQLSIHGYETVKCRFANQLFQFGTGKYLDMGDVQRTTGNFSTREEGDKAVIEAIEFAYAHRSPDMARAISTEIISDYMRYMNQIFFMTGVRLSDVRLPPVEKWAEKHLEIKDRSDAEMWVAVIGAPAKPKVRNFVDTVVPDYQFQDVRHIMVRALYDETIKHMQGDENALLRVRIGAALADFLSREQLQALHGSFRAETAKDANTVWPSFHQLVNHYITHRPGSSCTDKERDAIIDIANDYLTTGLDGLNAANRKAARVLIPHLTEDTGQWGDYEPRFPMRNGTLKHTDRFMAKAPEPEDVRGLMNLQISP